MTILNWGTDEQKEKYRSKIIDSKPWGGFGVTEPDAATDVAAIKTSAIDKGDYYLVNGSKTWITHATEFDVDILFAKTNPKARHEPYISITKAVMHNQPKITNVSLCADYFTLPYII